MTFKSTKTFGHEQGLSCCFRQWRASSHCNKLHGYALAIRIEFEAKELDSRNWVVDFGSFEILKTALKENFDHKTVVAKDDPLISTFKELAMAKLCDLVIMDNVGCEAFAQHVFTIATYWVSSMGMQNRVSVSKVEVSEHGANSAIYESDKVA